jgi:hypothetical protein
MEFKTPIPALATFPVKPPPSFFHIFPSVICWFLLNPCAAAASKVYLGSVSLFTPVPALSAFAASLPSCAFLVNP